MATVQSAADKKKGVGCIVFVILAVLVIYYFNNKPAVNAETPIESLSSSATKSSTEKYTQQELDEFSNNCKSVQTSVGSLSDVKDMQSCNFLMGELSFNWNRIYGSLVEAKIDSSKFPFKSQESAIKALAVYQKKMFPKFRKAFAVHASELLWEHDCKAIIGGSNNDELILTGNYFLPNANKKSTYELLADKLKRFRFKRLTFKWFESYDESTYYDLKPEKDETYYSE